MTTKLINKLLLKYFDGETSLQEEAILRGYFRSENIDAQFIKYKPLFLFFNKEKNVEISNELTNKIDTISNEKVVEINDELINKININSIEKTIKNNDKLANKTAVNSNKKRYKMHVAKSNFYWLKIAASVAFLIVGSYSITQQFKRKNAPQIAVNQPVKKKAKVIILDESTDPELAFAEVEKALLMVSKNMKKGTDETTESLQKIKSATKVINQ